MESSIEFRFKGDVADSQQLPIEYVINLLTKIRDATYLIVAQAKDITFKERFKPSKEIKDNYIIKCDIPTKGSHVQKLSYEYIGQYPPVINPFSQIEESLTFIQDENNSKILHSYPQDKMRAKILSCIREALPKLDSGFYVEIITNSNKNSTPLDSRIIQKNITSLIDSTQNIIEEHMMVITGRLVSIDFEKRKIIINHPVTKRNLECYYNEDVEDMLFENRRELVQITGNVTLNENDEPKEITDVISIHGVDLSMFEIDCVNHNDKRLRFKNPLKLTPVLDGSEQLYTVSYPKLCLEAFAYTRQEVIDDVKSTISCFWDEYVLTKEPLSGDAISLKQNLIDMMTEVYTNH